MTTGPLERRDPAPSRPRRPAPALLAAALPLLLSGCLLAAGGAAAGTGIYLTSRGAEGVVHGNVDELTEATREAFDRLGVTHEGQKNQSEGGREVYGTIDEGDVTVELERRTDNATMASVRVKKSAVTWDKDMAKRILEEIQAIREG